MAVNKEFYIQLQAYALGCLDRNDLQSFREHIQSGEEYPWQELGEYQNLAALLPSILHVEMPEPQLKDKVARKLYRIRDEVRAKRTNELSSLKFTPTQSDFIAPPMDSQEDFPEPEPEELLPHHFDEPQYDEPEIDEEPIYEEPEPEPEPKSEPKKFRLSDPVKYIPLEEEETKAYIPEPEKPKKIEEKKPEKEKINIISRTQDFEVVTPKRKTSELFRPSHQTQIRARDPRVNFEPPQEPEHIEEQEEDFYKDSPPPVAPPVRNEPRPPVEQKHPEPYYEDDKPAKKPIVFIALIVLAVLLVAGGIFIYLSISSRVENYQNEVESLKNELKTLSSTGDAGKEFQAMLDMPATIVINLSSVQTNGYGKVIINPAESRGYLQLTGMPSLPPGKTYQLWINASGNAFASLGLFEGSMEVKYYPFSLPELSNPSNIRILLTQEPSGGSPQPGKDVYLSGNL